jgi:predicted DNA-binding transcriptional regulator AlpA
MDKASFQPRILRAKQAPSYLGMSRDVFNKIVRPYVREFPIGKQGVAFDRNELDQWADAYIANHAVEKSSVSAPSEDLGSQPARKMRSAITRNSMRSAGVNKRYTSADFYNLVDEILQRPSSKRRDLKKN